MRNVDLFDEYLHNRLSESDKIDFENQLKNDADFFKAFNEHKAFVSLIAETAKQENLKHSLKAIHTEEFGKNNIISLNQKPSFFKRVIKPGLAAACVAGVTAFGVIQYNNSQNAKDKVITTLLERITTDHIGLSKDFRNSQKNNYIPANKEASAFAITNNGYFLTALHTVSSADSVFIDNEKINHVKALKIAVNPDLDLALFKIEDSTLTQETLPYPFLNRNFDLGEKVFTLGYPKNEVVYTEGSISSESGANGDTSFYQISAPINAGCSGSPLFDEQGNVVGVVHGKITGAEVTGFATKSIYVYNWLKSLNITDLQDGLAKTKKSSTKNLKRSEQLKKLQPFVYNIKVYSK